MEKQGFLEKVLAYGKKAGFADCEVFYRGGKSFEVLILEGEVANYENSATEGIAFRGNIDGRTGYAYAERLTEDTIPFLVEQAKENAALLSEEDAEEFYAGEETYPVWTGVHPRLEALSVEEKIAAAKRMETAALAGAEEIASLDYCVLGTSRSELAIQNTKGLSLSYAKNGAIAHVSAIAKRGEETKTGSDFWKAQDWDAFHPEKTGREAAKRAASHLGAQSVASGKYDVIWEKRAMAALLGAFAGIFFGENTQKGFSMLQGKMGQKIAADCVTLRDDALLAGGYASCPFDHEGVSGKNKTVIAQGILCTLLYNRKAAKKDGVPSTGNGFRAGLTGAIRTGCTNFYLEKGAFSEEDLLAKLEDGLLLTSLMGLHAGANAVSGDFSLSAEGFLVKNGKIGKPVEQITVAGNFYQMLQDMEGMADTLYFSSGGIGAPSVLVRGMDIAGK